MPVRIQRRRAKGWTMPSNALYVGRPSRWGNPVKVDGLVVTPVVAVQAFRDWLTAIVKVDRKFLDPLRGKDLACWCPISQPCHADVLLELANVEPRR